MLTDIKTVSNETIAVVKYDIREFVDGIFNIPTLFEKGGATPTTMNFGFQGVAEFLL